MKTKPANSSRKMTSLLKKLQWLKHRLKHKLKKRSGCVQNKRKKGRRREMTTKRKGSSNKKRKSDRGRSMNSKSRNG